MAASTIGQCLDILNLLGDHVNNKKLLYNLCLVSRHFNHIFSKRLWRCLEFDDLNTHCFTDDERRRIILQSPSLQHTRILIYNIDKFDFEYHSNGVVQDWEAELSDLVRKLPNLESIVAHELEVSDDIMLALSNATSLNSLVLHFTSDIEYILTDRDTPDLDEYETQAFWGDRPCCILSPFKNLTRLTLLNIFGELRYWLKWVLDLLCQSPSLEHLSFSFATLTECKSGAYPSSYTFFSDLCNSYDNKSSKKLKLRSLRLNMPIRCLDLPTLSKLTDTTYLEDIYVVTDFEGEDHAALDVLSPDATPSLRRLTTTSFNRAVLDMFWERSLVTDRRLSIFSSSKYSFQDDRPEYLGPLAESAPSIGFFPWASPRDALYWHGNNYFKNIGLDVYYSQSLGQRLNADETFLKLCEQLGSMGSLEALWLEARTKIKSHASITFTEACNVQFVLSNLAAACRRLHYVKIGRLAWRIHPKVRHTKQQVCTFEEIDAWEAAAEGPAAFCCPEPLGSDVVHEDW